MNVSSGPGCATDAVAVNVALPFGKVEVTA